MAITIGSYAVLAIFLLSSILAIFLIAYLIYIRFQQHTYTERRFNFVALWSCTTLATAAIMASSTSIREIVFGTTGISVKFDGQDQVVIACIVLGYVYLVSKWAQHWNGLKSTTWPSNGPHRFFFIIDGASRTWRLAHGQPIDDVHAEPPSIAPLSLPDPIGPLSFHEQVREIAMARWPEFVIGDNQWVSDAQTWVGKDTSLDKPVLLVCVMTEQDAPMPQILEQVRHNARHSSVRLIVVCSEGTFTRSTLRVARDL